MIAANEGSTCSVNMFLPINISIMQGVKLSVLADSKMNYLDSVSVVLQGDRNEYF